MFNLTSALASEPLNITFIYPAGFFEEVFLNSHEKLNLVLLVGHAYAVAAFEIVVS